MSVRDSRHRVDLEVLVGADGGDLLDRTPVGEGRLSIVEPLVAQLLDVVGVDGGDSLSDLSSRDSAAELQEVQTDLLVEASGGLVGQELVEQVVSATEDLDLIEVVRVDGGEANTAVVHLSSEDLIAEEIVTEEAVVGASEVVGVGSGDVGQVAEERMHRVVLLVDIVEVLGVLVNSVRAEHVLQEKEGVVVLVLHRGSIIEDTNVGVDHLIVSNEEDRGRVDGLLGVLGGGLAGLGQGGEGLLNLFDDLGVVHVTGGNDDKVVAEVVGGVVSSEVIGANLLEKVSITLDGLTEHVISITVEEGVLERSLLVSGMVGLVLAADLLLEDLELGRVEGGVADGVTEKVDGSAGVILEHGQVEAGVLSVGVSAVLSAHGGHLIGELALGSRGGASVGHSLNEIGRAGRLEVLVSGASSNIDTDVSLGAGERLTDNSDAVGEGRLIGLSHEPERPGDGAERKLTVVILDGVLGELLLDINGGKTTSKQVKRQYFFIVKASFHLPIVLEDVLGDLVAESSGVLDGSHSSLNS